jgi:hypothetical protein
MCVHCSKGFAMIIHLWMYCTLIRIYCTLTLSLSFAHSPHPPVFNSFQCISYAFFLHRYDVFWYYSLSFCFVQPTPASPSNCPITANMFSIYVYMVIFVFAFVFIFWIYLPHVRENMQNVFLNLTISFNPFPSQLQLMEFSLLMRTVSGYLLLCNTICHP